MRVLAHFMECALIRASLLGILPVRGHAGRMEELSLHLRDGVRRQPAEPGPLPNARTCAGDFRAPMQPSTPGPPAAWHGTDQRSKALAACCARQGSGEDESPSRRCGRRDQCLDGPPVECGGHQRALEAPRFRVSFRASSARPRCLRLARLLCETQGRCGWPTPSTARVAHLRAAAVSKAAPPQSAQ